MARPYLADTNLYVRAANDSAFRRRFGQFILERGPLVVSAVVVAEVLIGLPRPASHAAALRAITGDTQPLAPIAEDWVRAGATLARLGGNAATKRRSFWNDALLAAQCARLGITLVTWNATDFRRLQRYLAVQAVAPFPQESS